MKYKLRGVNLFFMTFWRSSSSWLRQLSFIYDTCIWKLSTTDNSFQGVCGSWNLAELRAWQLLYSAIALDYCLLPLSFELIFDWYHIMEIILLAGSFKIENLDYWPFSLLFLRLAICEIEFSPLPQIYCCKG